MSDEAEFLKTLREKPNDDTTRLVYADWLDERGDPRAEFIRLRQQFATLTARINELSERFDPAWLAAVGAPELKQREITLRSGRWVLLGQLRQARTYAGLLEGTPNEDMNRQIIEGAERAGAQLSVSRETCLLLPPRIRTKVRRGHDGWPDREYPLLPDTVCLGEFSSTQPARDAARHASELVVVWFQDEFAFPIDPAVREQIRAIEWEKHAVDFDY